MTLNFSSEKRVQVRDGEAMDEREWGWLSGRVASMLHSFLNPRQLNATHPGTEHVGLTEPTGFQKEDTFSHLTLLHLKV